MTGDLFGYVPPKVEAGGKVSRRLVLHRQTELAWLLGRESEHRSAAKWVPKSKCSRGEGRDENVWTMSRDVADERGWL